MFFYRHALVQKRTNGTSCADFFSFPLSSRLHSGTWVTHNDRHPGLGSHITLETPTHGNRSHTIDKLMRDMLSLFDNWTCLASFPRHDFKQGFISLMPIN